MSFFEKTSWFSEWEPDLQIYYSKNLHSKVSNYRQTIREEVLNLLSKTCNLSVDESKNFLDLNQLPRFRFGSLSLCHSPIGSCFVFDPSGRKIGIDIEDPNRISEPVIKRITPENELLDFPEPKLMFSMKEATWKALNHTLGIATISEIKIEAWKRGPRNGYIFNISFKNQKIPGRGFAILKQGKCIACFLQ